MNSITYTDPERAKRLSDFCQGKLLTLDDELDYDLVHAVVLDIFPRERIYYFDEWYEWFKSEYERIGVSWQA